MKKIFLILTVSIATVYGQLPPISTGGADADSAIPEIPVFDDPEPPSSTSTQSPDSNISISVGNQSNTEKKETPPPSSAQVTPSPSLPEGPGPEQTVVVKPEVSKDIAGSPVFNAASAFMEHFKFEALFSSRVWMSHWIAPDMGLMRVTSMPQPLGVPRGAVLRWQRDNLGNPMVFLKARVNFPKIKAPDAASKEQPLENIPVVISQAVVFFQKPGGWVASASPLYVTTQQDDKNQLLVNTKRGQGVWRARE